VRGVRIESTSKVLQIAKQSIHKRRKEEVFFIYSNSMMSSYEQASLRYDEIEHAAPAARPLDFPSPEVHRACHVAVFVKDHRTGIVHSVKGVLMRSTSVQNHYSNDRAYLVKKKLAKSTYGSIKLCVVLQRRSHTPSNDETGDVAEWESTGELVVIKASSWERMRKVRGRNLEDPLKEASASQFVGNYHPHIHGCSEALQDEDYLYLVMPHCSGGDLYSKIMGTYLTKNRRVCSRDRTNEVQTRIWFRQLLDCLLHLQQKGMCHRDITLENLMLDANNNLVMIDFGLALRVPYVDTSNYGGVADVSEGNCRRLITKQGQSGNLAYLAPEVVEPENEFDGFAVDLWSAGVILFILLVGLAPFEWAHMTDYRFRQINKGKLKDLLKGMDVQISDDACHLMQNMLWRNPRKRLTLAQLLSHRWVVGSEPRPEVSQESLIPQSFFAPKESIPVPATTLHTAYGC
jgi:serine/threonine protein kinase